ncbi:TIR domain-containing protein [Helicobacter sp. MIT 99-5507]|uniref:TIR domain-containing protein n=1 Tax=Helicobacter sp. MIT 99-5507 TaxID=152489 RepID=UPI000E1E76F1|nr:TIR domain-containing protein [Helicobacter sp. MIT 99-5507]RDU58639.1 molecular chaperone Tir [Helicobacter sp. MIT 99-5507]
MKKVFFSFHYDLDSWRVQQIRNMGVVEGQRVCNTNDWEQIKKSGDKSIQNWIDKQMKGCDCVIVLIGEKTHTRQWVKYEVKRAKELGIPIFGIFIHNLKDRKHQTTKKGQNVFDIHCYEPNSKGAYQDIRNNLESWINKNITESKGKKIKLQKYTTKPKSLFPFFNFFGILVIILIFLGIFKNIKLLRMER